MSIFIAITFKEEVSDHDGYCSGGECDLSTRIYTRVVAVDASEITNDLHYYIIYANAVICNDDGSYYCDLGEDAKKAGLEKHDYRVTVLAVKLVDKNKARNRNRNKNRNRNRNRNRNKNNCGVCVLQQCNK